MTNQFEIGDFAVPRRGYGNCMVYGGTYEIIAVKEDGGTRSFFIDCPCRDIKCKVTGWFAIESDFRIIKGNKITPEERSKAIPLPSPDAAADFMKRSP
jgi:hypothetical protein